MTARVEHQQAPTPAEPQDGGLTTAVGLARLQRDGARAALAQAGRRARELHYQIEDLTAERNAARLERDSARVALARHLAGSLITEMQPGKTYVLRVPVPLDDEMQEHTADIGKRADALGSLVVFISGDAQFSEVEAVVLREQTAEIKELRDIIEAVRALHRPIAFLNGEPSSDPDGSWCSCSIEEDVPQVYGACPTARALAATAGLL